MNTDIHIEQKDPKVSYIENFVSEIESTICDQRYRINPDHKLSDDVRQYLIQRELLNLYHHIRR